MYKRVKNKTLFFSILNQNISWGWSIPWPYQRMSVWGQAWVSPWYKTQPRLGASPTARADRRPRWRFHRSAARKINCSFFCAEGLWTSCDVQSGEECWCLQCLARENLIPCQTNTIYYRSIISCELGVVFLNVTDLFAWNTNRKNAMLLS